MKNREYVAFVAGKRHGDPMFIEGISGNQPTTLSGRALTLAPDGSHRQPCENFDGCNSFTSYTIHTFSDARNEASLTKYGQV